MTNTEKIIKAIECCGATGDRVLNGKAAGTDYADYEKAIRKAYKHSKVMPKSHLSLQTKDHDPERDIQQFVRSIKRRDK